MFINTDTSPVTIIVSEDRWDAIDVASPRNIMLVAELEKIGGINHTVPPGVYHFNIIQKGLRFYATLDSVPKD